MGNIKNPYLLVALVLTLLVHALTVFQKIQTGSSKLKSKEVERRVVKLKLKKSTAKQIVRTMESKDKKENEKTKLLSKTNNFFHRQTKAKRVSEFNDGAQGKRKALHNEDIKSKSQRKSAKKELRNLKKFSFNPFNENKILKKYKKKKTIAKSKKGTKLGRSKGLASSNDFLENLPESDFSKLNTNAYKYFSFYDRIRKQLEKIWAQSLKENTKALQKRGGRVPASTNNITNLEVILDDRGQILKIAVVESSGINELDDAAVDSFNKAGSFPNPPKDLLVEGKTKIKWGFVVK